MLYAIFGGSRQIVVGASSAIAVVAIAHMFKWQPMRKLYRARRLDFALAMVGPCRKRFTTP